MKMVGNHPPINFSSVLGNDVQTVVKYINKYNYENTEQCITGHIVTCHRETATLMNADAGRFQIRITFQETETLKKIKLTVLFS